MCASEADDHFLSFLDCILVYRHNSELSKATMTFPPQARFLPASNAQPLIRL